MDAQTKAGLLGLIDHAGGHGWPVRRACGVLQVNDRRISACRARREAGRSLDDARPGT